MPGLRDVEIRSRVSEILIAIAVFTFSLPVITGYTLLILSSFSREMVTNIDPSSFKPTLINWILLFQGRTALFAGIRVDIWKIVFNTLVIALGISALVTLTGSLTGYALSRMNFAGRKHIMALLILLHAFPGSVLVVGVAFIYRLFMPPYQYIVYYSFFFVVVARAAIEIPMATWLMKGFFDIIPWEIEWSAIVDGASRIHVWWKILLPMIKPGLAAVMLFGFLAGWMDLIYVRTFLSETTLAVFIEQNVHAEYAYLPLVAATGTLYLLPTILFFIFAQKLIFTITVSGIKG